MMIGSAPLAALALMTPSGAGSSNVYAPIFMYGAIFAIFYFILIRPQQQQRKKHEETLRAIKRGESGSEQPFLARLFEVNNCVGVRRRLLVNWRIFRRPNPHRRQ